VVLFVVLSEDLTLRAKGNPLSNSQEMFWKDTLQKNYAADNSIFDSSLGVRAWNKMLNRISSDVILSYLECGSNIGRNIGLLQETLPSATANIIEIAELPYRQCISNYKIDQSFLGSIRESNFEDQFDLVFTSGVLIHVNPDDLLISMEKMYLYSKRYILIAEYFNRTPVMINYRGEDDRLFKRDFGKLFLENFSCKVIDYGFLWGHEFDLGGFDDITYWLFEKTN
jgi:pseudaminic acid biosynthesis-associated methylase